jgi:hypothetical protein
VAGAFKVDTYARRWWIPVKETLYTVLPFSRFLLEVSKHERLTHVTDRGAGVGLCSPLLGIAQRVRVVVVTRGPKKQVMHLFYGRTKGLKWDPERFEWAENAEAGGGIARARLKKIPFMKYST